MGIIPALESQEQENQEFQVYVGVGWRWQTAPTVPSFSVKTNVSPSSLKGHRGEVGTFWQALPRYATKQTPGARVSERVYCGRGRVKVCILVGTRERQTERLEEEAGWEKRGKRGKQSKEGSKTRGRGLCQWHI